MLPDLGRILATLGAILLAIGLLLIWFPGFRLGNLPGDFTISLKNGKIYLPLGSSLLISVLLTLCLWLVQFFRRP